MGRPIQRKTQRNCKRSRILYNQRYKIYNYNFNVLNITIFNKILDIDNQNSGSLIKEGKGSFGINVLDGIFAKYFKDGVGEELKEIVKTKLFSQGETESK